MTDYPSPDWTRAQIEAWEEAKRADRLMPLAREVASRVLHGKRTCEACGRSTVAAPLIERCRIKYSAKFKGRLFEAGAVLCHDHQTEPMPEPR